MKGLLEALDDHAVREDLIARLWGALRRKGPSADARDYLDPFIPDLMVVHARAYFERAVADLAEKNGRLTRDKPLRRFRNREIAHAQIDASSGRNPTFGDLRQAIGLADDMRRNLSFLIFRIVLNVEGERDALSRNHRRGARPPDHRHHL